MQPSSGKRGEHADIGGPRQDHIHIICGFPILVIAPAHGGIVCKQSAGVCPASIYGNVCDGKICELRRCIVWGNNEVYGGVVWRRGSSRYIDPNLCISVDAPAQG